MRNDRLVGEVGRYLSGEADMDGRADVQNLCVGGYSANTLARSLGWVMVTVPSSLCTRLSPRKLVASRSKVTS